MYLKSLLFFVYFLFVSTEIFGQIHIQGNIKLDSTWENKIYASNIPSFNDFYKTSNELIIGESIIDSYGNWNIRILPESYPRIIRLHVIKKNQPKASLIIGGKDHNHGFMAIHKNKTILYYSDEEKLFTDFTSNADGLNQAMKSIKSVYDKWELLSGNSKNKKDKIALRKEAANELKKYADTASLILPAMYAIHLSDAGFNKQEINLEMNNVKKRLGNHPYFDEYPRVNNNTKFLLIFLIVLGSMLFMWASYKFILHHRQIKKVKLLNSLSLREKDVYSLLQNGKSNKEIAEKLIIELSTVKSHINNIYTKLKITSRNQLHNFKHFSFRQKNK